MWTGLSVLLALAGAVWFGIKYERRRVQAEAGKEYRKLAEAVRRVKADVAGLDDDELDALVYGPDRLQRHSGDQRNHEQH